MEEKKDSLDLNDLNTIKALYYANHEKCHKRFDQDGAKLIINSKLETFDKDTKEFIIYMDYQKETENRVISNAVGAENPRLNKIVIKDGQIKSIQSFEKDSEEEKVLEKEKEKAEIKKNDNANKLISGHFYKKAFDLASKQAHETIENELVQHGLVEPEFEKNIAI